ncbi:mitochondrial ribonuclease P protein 1 homolog [Planococcus citri]|uniref:mitochondrial ribonuclease P protein 1 homolog n=1 Tax=Planococcus citri TaxID=170843 RepID=UPI0031F8965B
MNKCPRLLLRFSSNLIKTHCIKLSGGLPGTLTRYSLASQPRYFSSGKDPSRDLQDEFENFEDDVEPNYQDVNADEITGGDPELIKMLNLCQMEINMLAQSGAQVPLSLNTEQWCELVKIQSKMQRVRFLKFLWLKEIKRKNHKRKKLINHEKYLEAVANRGPKKRRDEIPTNAPMVYGLSETSLVHRIRDVEMNRFYNYKLLQAMQFGPNILVDCGYESFMNARELNLCAKQLLFMWSENRDCNFPYHLTFCNLKKDSPVLKKLRKTLVGIDTDPTFPFNYTEKNYTELYPKENLVYLTPHCTETLKYNGNDIHIIGAMVDKSYCEPISLAKAKKDGIRYAKFPLDAHLNWKMGVKSLTLNQCLAIMNDIKDGRDWPYAFRHVPRRKLENTLINEATKEIRDTRHTTKSIKERYRRNLVYDLLLPNKQN